MAGEYLGAEPPVTEHRCTLPPRPMVDWTVWRCDCGKAYRAEPYDPGHDTQPGDGPYVRWTRHLSRDAS